MAASTEHVGSSSPTTTSPTDCDVSPIHLFSSIQAHGALIAFSGPEARIQMVSNNVTTFLNREKTEVLGCKLDYVFDKNFVTSISKLIKSLPWLANGQHVDSRAQVGDQRFDAFLFQSDGLFVLELETLSEDYEPADAQRTDEESILLRFSMEAKASKSVNDLAKLVCRTVREVTGLDRVMVYRFAPPEWHGEVIAEDRTISSHAYLGHRFPATDIPLPARTLYLRNQVRLIADVQSEAVGLTPVMNPKTMKPLDMSDSRLRSAAPIHVEYLKNMGVRASFSVAITDGEDLWGLITCHHFQELIVSQSRRTICQIIADVCSAQVTALEKNQKLRAQVEFDFKLRRVFRNLVRSGDPRDEFFRQHRTITEAFDATGVALVDESLRDFAGLTPLKKDLEDLALALRGEMNKANVNVLAISSVASLNPKFEQIKDYASGVLAIRTADKPNSLLMLLRPERLREVAWGGDPRKQLEKRNFSGAIHPRESFATWTQKIQLHSKPWLSFEIDGISFLNELIS